MTDLPDNPDKLTEEQARSAPAAPQTDCLCDAIIEEVDPHAPGEPPPKRQYSRNRYAAKRARRWMQSHDLEVRPQKNGSNQIVAVFDPRSSSCPEIAVGAVEDKALATARLVLLGEVRGLWDKEGK